MNGAVGDLKYLSRTGRIKGSVAVVGNMLKIKPILRGSEDGYIVSYKNVRGRKAVLNELIRLKRSKNRKSRSSESHMQMPMRNLLYDGRNPEKSEGA